MNKIINEFEYVANEVIDEKEGIFAIFLADILDNYKYYYFVCENKKEILIKYVKLDKEYNFNSNNKDFRKKYLKKIEFKERNRRINSLINYVFNYEIKEDGLLISKKKNSPVFYCFLPSKNQLYSFDDECENVINNGFYDFINYLFILSSVDNESFIRKENDNESILGLAALLDDEITYFIENSSKNNLKKKLNKKQIKKEYSKICSDFCSMMNNYELVMTMIITDNVYQIGDALGKIKPEYLNWDGILKSKKLKFDNIINLVSNKDFVYNTILSDVEKEKIIENLDIDHQITMIMENLKNEEIMELVSKTNNWNVKLYIMKYIHSEE